MANPYDTLGVTRAATQDEIRNAYRKLAKRFHPDLNPGKKEAEQRFKEINEAYELIGEPESRARFDRGERAPFEAGQTRRGPFYYRTQQGPGGGRYTYSSGAGQEGDQDEFIESILRGFGARAEPEETHYRLAVSLRDAVHGAEREVTFPDGKRFQLKIPAGVRTGVKLRLPGQGVVIELEVMPLEGFTERGDDLVTELPVTLAQAVLGGEARVPTVDGPVMLKIPPRVNTGQKLKLSGKGLFNRQKGSRGDQIVALTVVLPQEIAPELEEAIRKWGGGHEPGVKAA